MSLADLIDHIPDLLDAIAETGEAYVADGSARLDTETAERHALERLSEGMDLSQVVIELAVLRDCILQVWDKERAPGAARPEVRFLNEVMVETTAAVDAGAILLRDGDLLVVRAAVGLEAPSPQARNGRSPGLCEERRSARM